MILIASFKESSIEIYGKYIGKCYILHEYNVKKSMEIYSMIDTLLYVDNFISMLLVSLIAII